LKIKFELDLTAIGQRVLELSRRFKISHFLLLYFAAHMLQIAFPSDGSMVFDEAYYVPASLMTLAGDAANLEHPPLGKLIGAAGIALFGNNWFGWRFPQAVISTVGLYLFYLVAKRFLGGDPWALGATILLGLDTVFFIHGGILLLDGPAFMLGFLTLELYFRKKYWWSAISMGLAFFDREFTLFVLVTLIVYHIVVNRGAFKQAAKFLSRYTLVALLVFFILLWAYDVHFQPAQATTITSNINANVVVGQGSQPVTTIIQTFVSTSSDIMWNPVQNILYEYNYHGPNGIVLNETTTRAYEHPLFWILPVDPFDSATYYSVAVTVTAGNAINEYVPIWYRAQPNLPLWYGTWLAGVGAVLALLRKKERRTALFFGTGIIANYLPSVTLDLLTRRIGFNYYMLYVLPYVAIGIVFAIKMLPSNKAKLALGLYVLAELAFFLWFFPVRPY
jgi:4-amino-4-deoxy-L-arabinose transferase-like glycosyltransferase